jgi:porin
MSCVDGGAYGSGTVYDHSLSLPLTVNLEKLADWKGATFFANAFWIAGESLSTQSVGDIANVSNISAEPAFRLQELWLEQAGCDQKLSLQLGLLAADTRFFSSDAAALFLNGTFGAFTLVGANLPNPPIYPMAAPGALVRFQPAESFYFQAAGFEGNAGTQDENPHGIDFPLSSSDGALIFMEAGYTLPNDATNALATTIKAGTFILTKRQPSWDAQTAGNNGGDRPNYGFYGVIQQDLLRQNEQVVTVFCRGGHAPSGRNMVDWYLDGGLNCTGLVPGRPDDVAGVAVGYSHFSHDWRRHEKTVNGQDTLDRETIIEATYCCRLAPWWTLQPDLQYVIAPGGDCDCNDAVIIGLRTTISF